MKKLIVLPLILTIAACANKGADYQPVLDGAPTAGYQSDLAACRSLARSQSKLDRNTRNSAMVGAGTGAVLGELDDDGDAVGGAIVGALAGGAAGMQEANKKREAILISCLRGRGHKVVG
ncbi:MAG: glycine zipper family protein [Silicimonas sp.]|nr:glycine zipper family protein [Silicimonas sp.]